MKVLAVFFVLLFSAPSIMARTHGKRSTTRKGRLKRWSPKKGINAGFIEFMSPSGIIFAPMSPTVVRHGKASSVACGPDMEPDRVDVSSNGATRLQHRQFDVPAEGQGRPECFLRPLFVGLVSASRTANTVRRSILVSGHDKPPVAEADWKAAASEVSKPVSSESAGDHSTGSFASVLSGGVAGAYDSYLRE